MEIDVCEGREAATALASGPLYCLAGMLGATSDHTLCTVDQDASRSPRSLWHFSLQSTSSSTRFVSPSPTAKELWALLDDAIDPEWPGDDNQAISLTVA